MDAETNNELWEVETGDQVHKVNFAEMTAWINQGTLLRIDRVRNPSLRWIEAGKVPSLLEFFNAKDAGEPIGPVVTTNEPEDITITGLPVRATDACGVHPLVPAIYICGTCNNLFCQECPVSSDGLETGCPFCGAACSSLAEMVKQRRETV